MTSSVETTTRATNAERGYCRAADPRRPVVRIVPPRRWPTLDLRELWAYRSLFFFLIWRDIKSRYSQTVLGAGWAVFQPLLTMVIFTVVFGRFARIPSEGAPYALFSLAALVPWTYFASAVSASSNSLVVERGLVTKVYFPRLVIPSAPVLASLVDFSVAFAVLLLVILGYGLVPSPASVLLLPLLVVIMAMTALGVGCWLSALNIQYRDVRHLTPFLVQAWLYASPVVYPMSLVPQEYRLAYALNPMVAVIAEFRAVLLGTSPPLGWPELAASLAGAILIFGSGVLYFRRTERIFADVA